MNSHDRIVTVRADQPALTATVRIVVDVIDDRHGKFELLANGRDVEVGVKIDPLSTVVRPGLPAKRFFCAGGNDSRFELAEMVAEHVGRTVLGS